MSHISDNAVLDRLLRHMAWANSGVLSALAALPEDSLALHAPGDPDWAVGSIARHLVEAAGFYCRRLGAEMPEFAFEEGSPLSDVEQLRNAAARHDAALRELAAAPESPTTFTRSDGSVVTRARSTILAQAIHHATEHRTQIASVLSAHGVSAIDLDEFDLWAFADFEGLGE